MHKQNETLDAKQWGWKEFMENMKHVQKLDLDLGSWI